MSQLTEEGELAQAFDPGRLSRDSEDEAEKRGVVEVEVRASGFGGVTVGSGNSGR